MAFNFQLCVECNSGKVENTSLMLCASCNFERRKQERVKAKVVKPVKKVSEKRAGQNQLYARLRKEYLETYVYCEVLECSRKSTAIHHLQGREGDKLTDIDNFMAVCTHCHEKIHNNPDWSIANGYMILRSTNN